MRCGKTSRRGVSVGARRARRGAAAGVMKAGGRPRHCANKSAKTVTSLLPWD
jgi:hypothetical protein